jgi:hypothetical protein
VGLLGSGVKDPNYVLRFAVIFFMGVVAFGAVLFWKTQLIFNAEYQEMPTTHEQVKVKKENRLKQQKMQNVLLKNLEE